MSSGSARKEHQTRGRWNTSHLPRPSSPPPSSSPPLPDYFLTCPFWKVQSSCFGESTTAPADYWKLPVILASCYSDTEVVDLKMGA
ncbi:hypothetical protein CapIbe_018453 [Capra ibex]